MATKKLIEQLTFQDAQAMFSSYCTLKPDHILLYDLEQIVPDSKNAVENVRDFYNRAILRCYPNETTIKASFLNQILFKMKRDVTIFELPVGGSRVDLCKINGASIAYEIKTDLDTLKRLDKQITDYAKIFEQTYVICSDNRLSEIERLVPRETGIYTFTYSSRKRYSFTLYRKSSENNLLNSERQLSLLLKSELISFFGQTKFTSRAETIVDIITHYSADEINFAFKAALKQRYGNKWGFLELNRHDIYEIDYQWFYRNQISPQLVYGI